jgi:hypothetical protein
MRLNPALVLAVLGSSCTGTMLQPTAVPETSLDDHLQIRGRVCTHAPEPSSFPVKIVFLIDSSGSMCVSDGPNSQNKSGLCEITAQNLLAQGITTPARVRALEALIQRFQGHDNISVALIPFDNKISNKYPESGFTPASDPRLLAQDGPIEHLQNILGKGTDYQGAIAEAYATIDDDIQHTISSAGGKASLPRTKYVVVLLTDGTPYPRCTSDDTDADPSVYATVDRPWGIWPDNPGDFCNPVVDVNGDILKDPNYDPTDPKGWVHDFTSGTDRNQNYQIFDAADRLASLKDHYNIGEIRLHTILLFNEPAVEACDAMTGGQCTTDLYNGMKPADAEKVAAWTLMELAVKHGNGTFQEFRTQADIQLGSLDYASLASRYVLKTLLADNHNALPTLTGPVVDSDGDGVADQDDFSVDGSGKIHPSLLDADRDQDGFPDAFEIAHRAEGFDPDSPDPRGCANGPGFVPKCSCLDTDGDGLSECMELYLGTDPTLVDSDADGIPDGVEVLNGLDPLVPNSSMVDRDLDGESDIQEIFAHTNSLLDDHQVAPGESYTYQVTAAPQADGSVCYDFLVSNIKLMTPASQSSGEAGNNFITLTVAEAPETGVARDYGLWRQACVFAQFAPPSVRLPAGPEVTLTDKDFILVDSGHLPRRPGSMVPVDYQKLCKGAVPSSL